MKCPYGYHFAVDWGMFPECDSVCPNPEYHYCKTVRSECTHKADFGSEIIANREARLLSNEKRNFNGYQCSYCGGWHIGRG
jgi:hypothetical protein